jgi:hypothetical protein
MVDVRLSVDEIRLLLAALHTYQWARFVNDRRRRRAGKAGLSTPNLRETGAGDRCGIAYYGVQTPHAKNQSGVGVAAAALTRPP